MVNWGKFGFGDVLIKARSPFRGLPTHANTNKMATFPAAFPFTYSLTIFDGRLFARGISPARGSKSTWNYLERKEGALLINVGRYLVSGREQDIESIL